MHAKAELAVISQRRKTNALSTITSSCAEFRRDTLPMVIATSP